MALKTTPEKKDKTQKKKEEEEKKQAETIKEIVVQKLKPNKTKNGQMSSRMMINSVIVPTAMTTGFCPTYTTMPSFSYSPILPITTAVSPYVPIYSDFSYPAANWTSIVTMQVQNPLYSLATMPISPVFTQPSPVVCPYTAMPISPVIAEPWLPTVPSTSFPDVSYEIVTTKNSNLHVSNDYNSNEQMSLTSLDPESYLLLPRELFPAAKMLAVDPNVIIDQLCKEKNIQSHSSWILDLEFGVPRSPVTRQIATYDANYNSIHCKNTPGAIHPGFESCSQDFKRTILFYYDSIVSTWYQGFMMVNLDGSVANFQSWLQTPMQLFGLCWR